MNQFLNKGWLFLFGVIVGAFVIFCRYELFRFSDRFYLKFPCFFPSDNYVFISFSREWSYDGFYAWYLAAGGTLLAYGGLVLLIRWTVLFMKEAWDKKKLSPDPAA